MRIFTVEKFVETRRVTYYSVLFADSDDYETDKFFAKIKDDPNYKASLEELLSLMFKKMGEQEGALEGFFRFENQAQALPGRPGFLGWDLFQFPLRLFCYRISSSLVILFNGDVKSSQSVQGSPYLSQKFHEANSLCKRLDEAFQAGTLIVTGAKMRTIAHRPPMDEWFI